MSPLSFVIALAFMLFPSGSITSEACVPEFAEGVGSHSDATPSPTMVGYKSTLFIPNPPGCDAYLYGSPDGHTYWGGCNTIACAAFGVDCQATPVAAGLRCDCPDVHGQMAQCWATIVFGPDGETVTGVLCNRNGCWANCKTWLWWNGNFYPCNCPPPPNGG